MPSLLLQNRPTALREALAPFVARLMAGRQIVHTPRRLGLRRPMPGLVFHAVPELFFQLLGSNRFTCPNERFVVAADEIAVMPRWLPHGESAVSGANTNFTGIAVGLDAGRIIFRWLCEGHGTRPCVEWSHAHAGPESDQIARYIDDLTEERPTGETYRHHLLCAAVVLLHDLLLAPVSAGESARPANSKVQRCREIIQADLSDPTLGARRLALELRCTPDHLSRLFRAEYGLGLNAYIREERLRQAQRLLSDPSLNISEVAWACGFRSANYFVRRFRSARGTTPKKARER